MKMIFSFLFIFLIQNVMADEVLNFHAQYKIPAASTLDESLSTFELNQYQVIIKKEEGVDNVELTYSLPEEMVGYAKPISMKLVINNGTEKVLSGKDSTALCKGPWSKLKCEMRFNDLEIDLVSVEEILIIKGKSASEIRERLEILSKFSGDPIGFTEVIE